MGTTPPRNALDRSALERVLARAAELQSQSSSDDTAGALSDEQIVELGKEVGLTPDLLRQAIAEERGRVVVPYSKGIGGGWFGAASLSSARTVRGTPDGVLQAVDAMLRADLAFDVKRRFPDRVVWEPRRTFVDVMRMQFRESGEGTHLRLAHDVGVTVASVDAQRTHVRVDASLTTSRASATTTSVVVVGGGALGTVVLSAMAVVPIVAVPVMVGLMGAGLIGVRAKYRAQAIRVATALEQLLDRLEFGPAQKQRKGIVDKLLG